MIYQNQYITVTFNTASPTLNTCNLEVSLIKNNEYYFNSKGIYVDILDANGDSVLDKHIKWTPPKHDEARESLPLDGFDGEIPNLQYISDRVDILQTVGLDHSDVDKRIYYTYVTLQVYYNYVPVSGSRQTLYEESIRLESVVLPLPRLHEFMPIISSNYTQEELDEDILKVDMKYKAVLPHYDDTTFYSLELTCDYSPGTSLYKTNVESIGSIEYEVPTLARGEIVSFTLKIYKEMEDGRRRIYVEQVETLLIPRAKFQTLFVKDLGRHLNVKTLYVKKVIGYDSLNQPLYDFVNVKDVFVKSGGLWYTG